MNKILIVVEIAYIALKKHKLRTFLTMLGIIIGVAAVISMLSIGQGARTSIEEQVNKLGTNVIMVIPGSVTRGGMHFGWGSISTLTDSDAKAIQKDCDNVAYVSPFVRTNAQVVYGNQNWYTSINGVSPEFVIIRDWQPEEGVYFTHQETNSFAKVCLLGKTVVKNLFEDENPIGQMIRIKKITFKVIGVLSSKGAGMGGDQDDVVIVPYTTAQKKLMGITHINTIWVSARNKNLVENVQDEITELLIQRHHITAGREKDFTIRNMAEMAQTGMAITTTLTILLGSIAAISLLVGGIGIMNIMLVAVNERIREIGIRMAVGAKEKDILLQFLIEAVVISSFGGLIGIFIGVGVSGLISKFAGWSTSITLSSIILSFFFSSIVGLFFGLFPAKKASKLNPIEALRYE